MGRDRRPPSADCRTGRPDSIRSSNGSSIPGAPSSPSADEFGDHDGETIGVADLRAMREAERERFESTDQVPPRQPRQGRIRLSTGRVVELERAVIIGRRPRSPRASGDSLPILIAVDSPAAGHLAQPRRDSRSRASTSSSPTSTRPTARILLRGGQDPVRLHPGEPTVVVSGDVVDLGDGITITVEELP